VAVALEGGVVVEAEGGDEVTGEAVAVLVSASGGAEGGAFGCVGWDAELEGGVACEESLSGAVEAVELDALSGARAGGAGEAGLAEVRTSEAVADAADARRGAGASAGAVAGGAALLLGVGALERGAGGEAADGEVYFVEDVVAAGVRCVVGGASEEVGE
jgi:hypothetical protein